MASSRSPVFAVIACALVVGTAAACAGSSDDVSEPDAAGSSSSSGTPNVGGSSSSGASGTSSSGSGNDDFAEAPTLTAIEPSTATVGSAGPTLVVRGKNFVPRTVVQLDGAELQTSFIDTTELRATLPTERLATPGILVLTVGTSPPGGGASTSLDFTVENPEPTLTRVSGPIPPSAQMGSAAVTLELEGGSFVSGAKVRWAGQELSTTFVSATKLRAEVAASFLVDSGVFELDVVNPAPGGGASAKLTFTVTNPTVQLTTMSPSSANVGSGDLELTLTGNGFIAGKSVVYFNNETIVPTVTSATTMSVVVPALRLGTVGLYAVSVLNPNPGGGLSTPLTFNVVNPAPTMSSLTPNAAVAGASPTTVTISGRDFLPSSKITIDNQPTAATFVDSKTLRFTIPANVLVTGGVTHDIRVENLGPGGGTAVLPFSVRNNAATLDSVVVEDQLNSNGLLLGASITLALNGTGFINGTSVVYLNGAAIASTVQSPTKIAITITPTQAALAFKVINGASPESNTITLTACAPVANALGLPGSDVVLSSSGPLFTSGPAQLFSGLSGTTCGAGVTFRSGAENSKGFSAFIVQNTSGKDYALEAYATCSGAYDDAYLALYHRDTVPVTDAERKACTGVVSDGALSGTPKPYTNSTKYASLAGANTGGSSYCPGLTTDNGGSPTIRACETWVAYIQADTVSHTPPQKLSVNLWPLP